MVIDTSFSSAWIGMSDPQEIIGGYKKVVSELGIDVEVEYITDVSKIVEMGVITSPVLAINGRPVLTGGGKSEEDIKNALKENY